MKLYLKFGLVAVLAFLAGKYLFPPKPEIKETAKTVTVEKIVERRNVEKTTRVTEKPDGTKVTETTEKDRSIIVDNSSSKSQTKTEIKGSAKITLGLLAIKNVEHFRDTDFAATVTVPLFGNLKAQALGTTNKQIGLGLALEF